MTLIKRSLVPAGRAGNGTAESYGVNRIMWDFIWDYDNGYTAISMEYLWNIHGMMIDAGETRINHPCGKGLYHL